MCLGLGRVRKYLFDIRSVEETCLEGFLVFGGQLLFLAAVRGKDIGGGSMNVTVRFVGNSEEVGGICKQQSLLGSEKSNIEGSDVPAT